MNLSQHIPGNVKVRISMRFQTAPIDPISQLMNAFTYGTLDPTPVIIIADNGQDFAIYDGVNKPEVGEVESHRPALTALLQLHKLLQSRAVNLVNLTNRLEAIFALDALNEALAVVNRRHRPIVADIRTRPVASRMAAYEQLYAIYVAFCETLAKELAGSHELATAIDGGDRFRDEIVRKQDIIAQLMLMLSIPGLAAYFHRHGIKLTTDMSLDQLSRITLDFADQVGHQPIGADVDDPSTIEALEATITDQGETIEVINELMSSGDTKFIAYILEMHGGHIGSITRVQMQQHRVGFDELQAAQADLDDDRPPVFGSHANTVSGTDDHTERELVAAGVSTNGTGSDIVNPARTGSE